MRSSSKSFRSSIWACSDTAPIRETNGTFGPTSGAIKCRMRRCLGLMGPVSYARQIYWVRCSPPVYPIRTTVTDYTKREDATITRHGHPGYTLSIPDSARQYPLETYTKGHELYAKHEALRADFAKGMREAKICVFDASLERKLIRKVSHLLARSTGADPKYAQALLSGCVIAADLPTEHEEALERFTIKLKPSWGIDRIREEIDKYLAQPANLHQMALDGLIYARQHLTTT